MAQFCAEGFDPDEMRRADAVDADAVIGEVELLSEGGGEASVLGGRQLAFKHAALHPVQVAN